jgi:hypothetical protein
MAFSLVFIYIEKNWKSYKPSYEAFRNFANINKNLNDLINFGDTNLMQNCYRNRLSSSRVASCVETDGQAIRVI